MGKKFNTLKHPFGLKSLRFASCNKKKLIMTVICAVIFSANTRVACANYSPDKITLHDVKAITSLRKFYNSPVKELNSVIRKTGQTKEGLPVYSFVKGKSYINGKISEQKKQQPGNIKHDVISWLTNKLTYSRKDNDPEYVENIKVEDEKLILPPLNPLTKSTDAINYNYDNIETSLITLRINKQIAYDFEVIVWPDGSISVPIKTLAEILDINVSQNHVNHNISFEHPVSEEAVTVDYKNNLIIEGTNQVKVKEPKMVFIKSGFLLENDIFVHENIARELLDIKSNFIEEHYAMNLTTTKMLKAIIELTEEAEGSDPYSTGTQVNEIENAENLSNKLFSINKFNYRFNSSMNATRNYNNSSNNAFTTAGFMTTGRLLGGEYNLGTNMSYGNNRMMVSGYRATLDYVKPKYQLSIGATNSKLTELTGSNNLWGVRFGTPGAMGGNSYVPRIIEGSADDNTYVELYVNNSLQDRQMVQNGRFEFNSLKYDQSSIVHFRVEQLSDDGNRKVVYNRKFSRDNDKLAPGQKQYLVFSGVDASAISNSFTVFGDSFDRNYVKPIKYITGAKFKVGITEDLTMGLNVANDFIIRRPSKVLKENYRGLNTARAFRTGDSSYGTVMTVDLYYEPSDNLNITSEFGLSKAGSKINPEFDSYGADFGGFVTMDYRRKDFSLLAKGFSYGPNFYSPGSANYIDRRGVELNTSWKISDVNFSAHATRYNSNLDNYFDGGLATVSTYGIRAAGQVDKFSTVRAGVRTSTASNAFYSNRDLTYDITLDRKIGEKARLSVNYSRTHRKANRLVEASTTTRTDSRLNADLNFDAGKLGIVRLSHEMMMLEPEDRLILAGADKTYFDDPIYSKNVRLSFNRIQLPIKNLIFSPNVGYRYGGQDKGVNFGCNLGYVFKTGRQIALNYAYNSSFARYMSGALSFGKNKSHSLSVNFSDSIDFGVPRGLKNATMNTSVFDSNKGIVKGKVYIDLNQNGVYDEGEAGLEGIDINFQNLFKITTDEDGNFIATLPQGLMKIGIDRNNLPVLYTPTVADALINVKPRKLYEANLGIIVTPGSVSGSVTTINNNVRTSDIVVLLIDENGKEVKYTTTDSRGGFYIGSIPPGNYNVVIDPNYLDYKELFITRKPDDKINIPVVMDDFIDIDGLHFEIDRKKIEVKRF
jgi:hypothetical protein